MGAAGSAEIEGSVLGSSAGGSEDSGSHAEGWLHLEDEVTAQPRPKSLLMLRNQLAALSRSVSTPRVPTT